MNKGKRSNKMSRIVIKDFIPIDIEAKIMPSAVIYILK